MFSYPVLTTIRNEWLHAPVKRHRLKTYLPQTDSICSTSIATVAATIHQRAPSCLCLCSSMH